MMNHTEQPLIALQKKRSQPKNEKKTKNKNRNVKMVFVRERATHSSFTLVLKMKNYQTNTQCIQLSTNNLSIA